MNCKEKRIRIIAILIMLLPVVFVAVAIILFIHSASTHTLLIIGGVILTWKMWKLLLKLLWLIVKIIIFLGVLYLLIF